MCMGRSESKFKSMFAHLRNSIAHGRFGSGPGEFIGFDWGNDRYGFFIRTEPVRFMGALDLLLPHRSMGGCADYPEYLVLFMVHLISELGVYEAEICGEDSEAAEVYRDLLLRVVGTGKTYGIVLKFVSSVNVLKKLIAGGKLSFGSNGLVLAVVDKDVSDESEVIKINVRGTLVMDPKRISRLSERIDEIGPQLERVPER